MGQKETNPRKEAVPLLIKRRGTKKRALIWIAKKLQERGRRGLANSKDCDRKEEKGKRQLVKERGGRGKPKEIFFEGDLKLNAQQREFLMARKQGGRVGSARRKGRAALKNVDQLWPRGLVKYQLAFDIFPESKKVNRETLKKLQSKLGDCIRFQEIDTGNRIFVNWTNNHGMVFREISKICI